MNNNVLSKFKFPMLKILALLSFIFIAGCATTAQQIGSNKYRTDCSGVFNSISECYAEANRVCEGNFNEIDRVIINHGQQYDAFCQCYISPVSRSLVFGCR